MPRLLMIESATTTPPIPQAPRAGEAVIRTRGLTRRYGDRVVVNDLNLEVMRGEVFGFLGPNGAGKTTTIRMLLSLVAPTAGTIEILGQDIVRHGRDVLHRVGALIETPALYLNLTGRANLRAMGESLGGISEERLQGLLHQVGLTQRQNQPARAYSLGMKQRLGIAVALLRDPVILMLDEPANGLDPAGIVEVRDLVRALAAAGTTIFISSHVLGEVQQICSRVAIINQGRLVTEATVEELTRTPGGVFLVWVPDAAGALTLLRQQPWGAAAQPGPQGSIQTPSPTGLGRDLNAFLAGHGFVADALHYQQESLEQVFLRLTGGVREVL